MRSRRNPPTSWCSPTRAESSFLRSRIDSETRAAVEGVRRGVAKVGGIGVAQLGARVPGNDDRDLADVALFGTSSPPTACRRRPPGVRPMPTGRSNRAASRRHDHPGRSPAHAHRDRRMGRRARLLRSGQPVGRRRHLRATSSTETAPTPAWATACSSRSSCRPNLAPIRLSWPDSSTGRPAEHTESLTLADAVERHPRVEQQRSTFNQIIGVTVVIAIIVVALFFALLTVERTSLYGVLKAVAPAPGRSSPVWSPKPWSSR